MFICRSRLPLIDLVVSLFGSFDTLRSAGGANVVVIQRDILHVVDFISTSAYVEDPG